MSLVLILIRVKETNIKMQISNAKLYVISYSTRPNVQANLLTGCCSKSSNGCRIAQIILNLMRYNDDLIHPQWVINVIYQIRNRN